MNGNNVEDQVENQESQDADSGIEVKAAINENKEDSSKSEPDNEEPKPVADKPTDDSKSENSSEEALKSPKSLKELSGNVVRANSTSAENTEESGDSSFANFESAVFESPGIIQILFCLSG